MASNSMPPVLQNNLIPYYYQIREIIRHKIIDGEYGPGDKIPSEAELQEYFGVSRGTIRKAVDSLVAAGMLRREQGMGTFVSEPKIDELLSRLVSFSEEMKLKGKVPGTSHILVSQTVPSKLVADALDIPPGESVLRIERVRCADSKPVVILTSYLPARLGVRFNEDFSGSLFELLETKYGVDISLGDQVIEAARADQQQAGLLDIEKGDPVLVIRRTSYSKTGIPVEYVEGIYRADRYSYRIQIHRDKMR
jgi:GntR family transcriptional regulator